MCCIMWCFSQKWVKWSLCLLSLALAGAVVVIFYFASVFKNEPIFGIIGFIYGYDVQNLLYLFSFWVGIFIIIIMLCGFWLVWKRSPVVQWFFMLMTLTAMWFFVIVGIGLLYGANYAIDEINEVCDGGDNDSDLAKAFDELYETSDTIFCVDASSGCVCYLNHIPIGGARASATYISSPSPTIRTVQECSSYLETAFADYDVDFDGVSDIEEYLGYFGEIEESYSCSGVCNYQSVYYFSNSENGAPEKKCQEFITDDILRDIVGLIGIAYLSTGCAFFLIWCVQYGFCCRNQNNRKKAKPGSGRSKRF